MRFDKHKADAMYEQYVATRPKLQVIHNELIKSLDKDVFHICAPKIGIPMREKTLIFSNETEMTLLMDHILYAYRKNGLNSVDRLLQRTDPAGDPEKHALLTALSRAHYSIFRILEVEVDWGVFAQDLLFDGDPFFLMDIHYSITASPGILLATRTIPLGDFAMTSGAGLPADEKILDRTRKNLPDLIPNAERRVANQPTLDEKAAVERHVLRLLLKTGASDRIEYQ